MTRMKRGMVVGVAGFLMAPTAGLAEEKGWEGKAEVSFVDSAGNTDTRTLGAKVAGSYEADPNRYFARAAATYGETDGEETANKWFLEGRYERTLTDRLFAFVTADWLKDKFSGYDYRVNVGPGLGFDLVETPAHKLKVMGSVLWSYDNHTADPPGTDSYASGKVAGDYRWKISDNLKFRQYADYRTSFEDANRFLATSDTSLEVKVAANMALGLSYLLAYDNDPAEGKEYTDRTFVTSLVVTF